MDILSLFPTAVGRFKIDRELTNEELEFINSQEKRTNVGNLTSVDNYILKQNQLSNLNDFLLGCTKKYFNEIYKPASDVSIYITQSWLNYTSDGGFHHKHTHSNSLISGVFYIKSDSANDKIHFYNDVHKQIRIVPTEFTYFNSESWWLEAWQGTLYLFPSNLIHTVEPLKRDDIRISLSFNTFLKGNIGSNYSLTELVL